MYCDITDVVGLMGNLPDEIEEKYVEVAINNSTAWIEANLKRHYLPIPTTVPQALKTVAIYHSASDLILNFYQGADYIQQYDTWFNKAQTLLESYIEGETVNTDDNTVLNNNTATGHRILRGYKRKWLK